MGKGNRTALVFGILLISAGILAFLLRFNPQLQDWFMEVWAWPLTFVVLGVLLLLLGLIVWEPGMCVPAVIMAGLGGIFYYQTQTGDWTSWAYMWALIPGFVGIGIILSALLERKWHSMKAGFDLVFISAVLYLVLASIFGGLTLLGPYGPAVLLILLGVYVLIRGAISSRNKHITG
jgi:hypothetical protein